MRRYNPHEHHRRSIRLREYDYSQPGAYFVTLCARDGQMLFERYPALYSIVHEEWYAIPGRFSTVKLDAFVIMPNHIHGIVMIQSMETGMKERAGASPAPTLGDVVRAFKSITSYRWLQYISQHQMNVIGKFWQRNYYEHIIRSEDELNQVRTYIANNPLLWELDEENPNRQ